MAQRLIFILVFCLLLGACHLPQTQLLPKAVGRGASAPNFSLPSSEGVQVSLQEFQGKVVLVHFWATWCIPCLQEINSLKRLRSKFSEKHFEILGVNVEDPRRALFSYLKKKQLNYPVLFDSSKNAMQVYGVKSLPHSVVVDRKGRLILFKDNFGGGNTTAITGARKWDSAQILDFFENLVEDSSL